MRIVSYLVNIKRVEKDIRKEYGLLPTHIEVAAAIHLSTLNGKPPTARELGRMLCGHKQHVMARSNELMRLGFVERYHTSLKAANFKKKAPGYGDAYVYSLTYKSIDMLTRYDELMEKYRRA